MTDDDMLALLDQVADLLPGGSAYIIAVQREGDPAPLVYHTMADDEALANALRNMARALEGDA